MDHPDLAERTNQRHLEMVCSDVGVCFVLELLPDEVPSVP